MATHAGFNSGQAKPVGVIPLWWVVAPGLLGAVVLAAFVLVYGALTPYSATPAPATPTGAAGGLSWGYTTIYNRPQMKSWLRAHGAPYRRWKRRHPAALAIITPKTQHHAHPRALKHKHLRGTKRHRAP